MLGVVALMVAGWSNGAPEIYRAHAGCAAAGEFAAAAGIRKNRGSARGTVADKRKEPYCQSSAGTRHGRQRAVMLLPKPS